MKTRLLLVLCILAVLLGVSAAAEETEIGWEQFGIPLIDVDIDENSEYWDKLHEEDAEEHFAHNLYVNPVLPRGTTFSDFMVDFRADYATPDTYWQLFGFYMDISAINGHYEEGDDKYGGAYAGLQKKVNDGDRAIMSFWDVFYTDDKGLEHQLTAELIYPENAHADHYPHEGWHMEYIPSWEWHADIWYRAHLKCYDNEQGHTIVEMWLRNLTEGGSWQKVCAYDTKLIHSSFTGISPLTGDEFYGWDFFMENIGGYDETHDINCAYYTRTFELRNLCYRVKGSKIWEPVYSASLQSDENPNELKDYDPPYVSNKKGQAYIGAQNNVFFGISNGYGENAFAGLDYDEWKRITGSADDASSGWWTLLPDGTLVVREPQDAMEDYDDPALWPWYEFKDEITGIRFESGVSHIGSNAFKDYKSVTNVQFPNTLTSIGDYAFYGCSSLAEPLVIPDGVTRIGDSAFAFCTKINSVTVGNGVGEIGQMAFAGCSGMKAVFLPGSLQSIAQNAFLECGFLTDVFYQGSSSDAETIEIDANGNEDLTGAEWHYEKVAGGACSESIIWQIDADGTLSISGTGEIPDYLNAYDRLIPWYPCRDNITKVVIGDGITGIGRWAFGALEKAQEIVVGKDVGFVGDSAFFDCKALPRIELPEGLVRIGEDAFHGCSALEQIILPKSLEAIGDYAFMGSGLVTLVLPDCVAEIGKQSFSFCDNLVSVSLGSGMADLQLRAFSDCAALEKVYIPSALKHISQWAFDNCTALADVYYNGLQEECEELRLHTEDGNECLIDAEWHIGNIIATDVFTGGPSWTLYANGLLSIAGNGNMPDQDLIDDRTGWAPWYPFRHMITEIRIGDGVQHIGQLAFFNLCEVRNVEIGTGVSSIGWGAFSSCSKLPYIALPDGITSIEQNLFDACFALTEIGIPTDVTVIKKEAFRNCGKLRKVTLPSNVRSIKQDAFLGCGGLEDVYYEGTSYAKDILYTNSLGGNNDLFNANWHFNFWIYRRSGIEMILDAEGVLTVSGKGQMPLGPPSEHINLHLYRDSDGSVHLYDLYIRRGPWDAYRDQIRKVVITGDVTGVAQFGFYNYPNLTSVEIRGNTKAIYDHAFEKCPKLTHVSISDSVETIGMHAFMECRSLSEITLGSGVRKIDADAFFGCDNLQKVCISGGSRGIGAFCIIDYNDEYSNPLFYAHNLYVGGNLAGRIVIPADVKRIADYAFYNCSSLTEVILAGNNTASGFHSFTGCSGLADEQGLVSVGHVLYGYYGNANAVRVPDSITSVEEGAFSFSGGLENLASLSVPFIGSSRSASAEPLGYLFARKNPYSTGQESLGNTDYYIPASLKNVTLRTESNTVPTTAFRDCSGLTGITIEGNVASIDEYAFADCSALETLSLPDTVTAIGKYACSGCSQLNDFTLPVNVSSIGEKAFYQCTSLTTIEIPANLTETGTNIFNGCSGLTSLTIADGVTEIAPAMFAHCSNLAEVEIPDSVTSIGGGAFAYCSSLIAIEIPDSVLSIGESAFEGCSGLTEIDIPDSVTSIGRAVFSHCGSLTDVAIPDSVTKLGDYAFSSCSSLIEVKIPDSLTEIGKGTFISCSSLTDVTIPDSVTSIGEEAFFDCSSLTDITIPDSVTRIEGIAFTNCSAFSEIIIPDSVEHIGRNAFSNCNNLENITIPYVGESRSASGYYDSKFSWAFGGTPEKMRHVTVTDAKTIPVDSFRDDSWVAEVTVLDGCGTVGGYAFSNCSNLMTVTLPDSVENIEQRAFYGCSGLNSITMPASLTTIGDYAFYGCGSLTEISIPASVTCIGQYAFSNCSGLTAPLIIPGKTASIGNYAFSGCSGLTSVVLQDGIKTIGQYAFENCCNITEIIIPDSVETIASHAFIGCSRMTKISLPFIGYSRTHTGWSVKLDYIFDDNSVPDSLRQVTVTDTRKIPPSSFYGCGKLTKIILLEGVTSIEYEAFYACSNLKEVILPYSLRSIGNGAFGSCNNLSDVYYMGSEVNRSSITNCEYQYYLMQANWHYDIKIFTHITEDEVRVSGGGILTEIDAGSKDASVIVLEDNIYWIKENAFSGCTNLTTLIMPQTVRFISQSAFADCGKLSEVYFGGNAADVISISIWENNDPLKCVWHCIPMEDHSGLENVLVLPAALASVEDSVFMGTDSAAAALLPGEIPVEGKPGIILILEDMADN